MPSAGRRSRRRQLRRRAQDAGRAGLQKGLGPIKRSLALISRATRNRREARAWLNSPHPDLGERTPFDVMLGGQADAVVTLLENAIAGLPS